MQYPAAGSNGLIPQLIGRMAHGYCPALRGGNSFFY